MPYSQVIANLLQRLGLSPVNPAQTVGLSKPGFKLPSADRNLAEIYRQFGARAGMNPYEAEGKVLQSLGGMARGGTNDVLRTLGDLAQRGGRIAMNELPMIVPQEFLDKILQQEQGPLT